MTKQEIVIDFLQYLINLGADANKNGWQMGDMIEQAEKYGEIDSSRYVNADKIKNRLENRIDEFAKKQPEKRDCEAVQTVREFIHMLENEN